MAEQEHDRDVEQRVVEEERAIRPDRGVVLADPEQQPADEEERNAGGGDDRVHLLARVEPTLRRGRPAAQEAQVVTVEQVDLPRGGEQDPPVPEQDDEEEGGDPADPDVEVDRLEQLAAADGDRQRGQVEDQASGQEREEAEGVHPVQDALGGREALDVRGVRGHGPPSPLEWPTIALMS